MRFFISTLVAILPLCTVASTERAPTVTVAKAWARATPPGAATGAIYLELVNTGAADRLLGGTTPAARELQIHRHVHESGMMVMERLQALDLPTGSTVFEPGGLHIMLVGLTGPLKAGDVIEITLNLESAGELVEHFPVRDARR